MEKRTMVQEIHLFIDGKEVYFTEPPEILFTYQRIDYTNPSIIKNSFTKSIEIEGLPENNKVFGEIWMLDRTQNDVLFNPSKRVPFELYNNGSLLETGYAKLDEIVRTGYKVKYNITLYGGLGDFFYGLSYGFNYNTVSSENEDSDKELKLNELTFYSDTDDDQNEFDFQISKDTINDAWDALDNIKTVHEKTKWDYINFAPAYNGIPEDFDTDKVIINSNRYGGGYRLSVPAGTKVDDVEYTEAQVIENAYMPNKIEVSGTVYRPKDGYSMVELREKLNEWDMRDIRSYLQRPVLRVKGLFEAIKRYAKKKGGYDLEFDDDFFNANNPYYEDAWITLPMINSLTTDGIEQTSSGMLTSLTFNSSADYDEYSQSEDNTKKRVYTYDINTLPMSNTYKSASIDLRLSFNVKNQKTSLQNYTDKVDTSFYATNGSHIIKYLSCVDVQLIAMDDSGNVVGKSKHHCFTSKTRGVIYDTSYKYYSDFVGENPIIHIGYFKSPTQVTSEGVFTFNTDDEYNTDLFNISLEGELSNSFTKLQLVITKLCQYSNSFMRFLGYPTTMDYYGMLFDNGALAPWGIQYSNSSITKSQLTYVTDGVSMKSYQLINKKHILSQDGTPCKYMIDYCKLFNLYFDKNQTEKIITIRTRKNFYQNKVVDLSNHIDRKKDIKITPLAFSNKWYKFSFTEQDNKAEQMTRYYNNYSVNYGTKKIDTGYNFDNSENDLLEGNIYTNSLECIEKSKYFVENYNGLGMPVATFLNEWGTFNLFNITSSSVDTCDNFYISRPKSVLSFNYSELGSRYDFYPKVQFHDANKNIIDGNNTLLFFNGMKDTTTHAGLDVNYWITDDIPQMYSLNNNSCWLFTAYEEDVNGNVIAIKRNSLPVFSRMLVNDDNVIQHTFDFGKPNELFVPNYTYDDDLQYNSNIYRRYWEKYISDLYNVDTRIVTAYVKLDGIVEGDWLKRFYYFDNSIWCLTKIEDYNITSFDTTKCELAKVMDISDYRS